MSKLRAHTNIENCEEFALNELVILGTQFTTFPFHYLQQGGGAKGNEREAEEGGEVEKEGERWGKEVKTDFCIF